MGASREITAVQSVWGGWNQKDLQSQSGNQRDQRPIMHIKWMLPFPPPPTPTLKEQLALEPPKSTLQMFWSCLKSLKVRRVA